MSEILNTLSAMPGDKIDWADPAALNTGTNDIVESCGFQPIPGDKKGGKIWTYRTLSGAIVPHELVTKIQRQAQKTAADYEHPGLLEPDEEVMSDQWDIEQAQKHLRGRILCDVQLLNISGEAKVAIHCLLDDKENLLELAQELILVRSRQLKELGTEVLRSQLEKLNLGKATKPK